MVYSFTQISHYLACPRRYRHRCLDGWQEKDSRAGMLFGRAFLGGLFPSGAEFERAGEVEIFLRESKQDQALQRLKSLPAIYGRPLLEPCLQRGSTTRKDPAVQKLRSALMAEDDPFSKYLLAAWDSLCGQSELASSELRRAIEQNYCAYPQMETDPLLARPRATPQFAEIRSLGIACRQRFLEHRKQRSSK